MYLLIKNVPNPRSLPPEGFSPSIPFKVLKLDGRMNHPFEVEKDLFIYNLHTQLQTPVMRWSHN